MEKKKKKKRKRKKKMLTLLAVVALKPSRTRARGLEVVGHTGAPVFTRGREAGIRQDR